MNIVEKLFKKNRNWADEMAKASPEFFVRLSDIHESEYLWINSGQWIIGSRADIGGRGIVCACEVNGKLIGKVCEPGSDGTTESAHHYW